MMNFPRRGFFHLAIGAVALLAPSRIAWGQVYPTRPITVIVPFAAGGTSDVIVRIVGEHMSRTLGQQLVVENVVGAGGTTGTIRTMRASTEGYTIQLGNLGTHAAAVALYPNLAYRPDVDFEPVGVVAGVALVIMGKRNFPPNDLGEFIAYVKANADMLNMAHTGVGSITHFTCALLNSILGVRSTQVPFTGGAPALNALIGGQVDYMCNTIPDVVQQIQSNIVKAYAISTAERNPALSNVPTAKEAGLPEFQALAWNALFAPKGTPRPVLDKLADSLDKALDDPSVRKRLLDLGCDIPEKAKRGPQPLAALVKSEIERWTPIIKAMSIK